MFFLPIKANFIEKLRDGKYLHLFLLKNFFFPYQKSD